MTSLGFACSCWKLENVSARDNRGEGGLIGDIPDPGLPYVSAASKVVLLGTTVWPMTFILFSIRHNWSIICWILLSFLMDVSKNKAPQHVENLLCWLGFSIPTVHVQALAKAALGSFLVTFGLPGSTRLARLGGDDSSLSSLLLRAFSISPGCRSFALWVRRVIRAHGLVHVRLQDDANKKRSGS